MGMLLLGAVCRATGHKKSKHCPALLSQSSDLFMHYPVSNPVSLYDGDTRTVNFSYPLHEGLCPVFQIRIRIVSWYNLLSWSVSGSRIQEGKQDQQNLKKVNKLYVLKCWIFSFEDWSFSCSLDVLYGGKVNCNFWSAVSFSPFLVIKTLDPDPDPVLDSDW
jgi:hypothetical protein